MSDWRWSHVYPGKAVQNVAHFSQDTNDWEDTTAGEAYYTVGNTGKTFEVRIWGNSRTSYDRRAAFDLSGMGKGQREFSLPGRNVPATLVLTGSESFGFITSLQRQPLAWMNSIEETIKDRMLKQAVMPGTHNAGLSHISPGLMSLGTATNTQNQGINTYDQLRAGSRWFDVRVQSVHSIVNINNYRFWTTHVNDETADTPIGASGEPLEFLISNINRFTSENPGEVIVLQFRYLNGIRETPSGGPLYWGPSIKDDFHDKLKAIDNRCANLRPPRDQGIEAMKMSELMRRNGGDGCVLIFLDTAHLTRNMNVQDTISPGEGIYDRGDIKWTDGWPEKELTAEAAVWNIDKWKENRSNFLVSQWLVTPSIIDTLVISLERWAVTGMNPSLYWHGVKEITPTKFPNVIMVDYIGQNYMGGTAWSAIGSEMTTLVMGLNLYTISENCGISEKRSPLLPPSNNNLRVAPIDNPAVTEWNGVIFANGTTLDVAPEWLHLGRPEILRKGTVFSNGTVITEDIPNPEFQQPTSA